MRTLFAAALSAGTILAATPAVAQQVNPTFTGPRVEGIVGYDNLGAGDSADSNIRGDDQNIDGFLYGVNAGFDFAAGGAVIGADAEYTDSTGRVETNTADPDFFGFGRVQAERDLYVGLRAGLLLQPNLLVYLKGGYTNLKLGATASDGETELAGKFKLDGYRIGVGAETSLSPKTFAKIEYRYSNYSNAEFDQNDRFVAGDLDADADRHQLVAGVGLRF